MVGILVALFLPFGLFVGTFWTMSFELYYRYPQSALMVVACAFFFTLVIGAHSTQAKRSEMVNGHHVVTWHHFIFFTCLIACFLGTSLGYLNFTWNAMRYYDYISLRKAVDADPGQMQGLQVLDAGEIDFKTGTHLDHKMNSVWHKTRTYCVAPLVSGDGAKLANYDFWAVGMDCCSARPGDFSCGDVKALNGLRVMDEGEIRGYKLAVEQATAAHNIQSTQPIFLYMMQTPYIKIKGYFDDARTSAMLSCVCYFIMQSVLVAAQSYKFGKDSPSGYLNLGGQRHSGHSH